MQKAPTSFSLCFLLVEVAASGDGGDGTVGGGGRDLADALGTAVARDEDGGIAREAVLARLKVAVLVECHVLAEGFVFGDLTVEIDETEQNRVLHATVKLSDPEIDLPEVESADASDEEVAK